MLISVLRSTADVVAGTGGIDASIGFETMRAENSGASMNDSMGFWSGSYNKYARSKFASPLG
jgi:hypothetical protein